MDMISEFNVLSSQRVDKTDEKSKDFLNENQIEFNLFLFFQIMYCSLLISVNLLIKIIYFL